MIDVAVIGAGMAGLTAARLLVDAGLEVAVVDKGRGVGGRMATRRLGEATCDHGAQFFTSRSDWFGEQVRSWLDAGVAHEWCRGFRTPADGHPRYAGTGGMTSVPKHLAAALPDVRTGVRVTGVEPTAGGWHLGGAELTARAVLLTSPVPQSIDLLPTPDVGVRAALERVAYSPTLALMVVTDGPTSVPAPGGVQLDEGPLSWVGDNLAKGASRAPAVTLHASPAESTARYDQPDEEVVDFLLDAGRDHLGTAAVVATSLMRWRYAQPTVAHDERHLVAIDGAHPIVCAGDAFGEAKVEGAARSGRSAALALLERLG